MITEHHRLLEELRLHHQVSDLEKWLQTEKEWNFHDNDWKNYPIAFVCGKSLNTNLRMKVEDLFWSSQCRTFHPVSSKDFYHNLLLGATSQPNFEKFLVDFVNKHHECLMFKPTPVSLMAWALKNDCQPLFLCMLHYALNNKPAPRENLRVRHAWAQQKLATLSSLPFEQVNHVRFILHTLLENDARHSKTIQKIDNWATCSPLLLEGWDLCFFCDQGQKATHLPPTLAAHRARLGLQRALTKDANNAQKPKLM